MNAPAHKTTANKPEAVPHIGKSSAYEERSADRMADTALDRLGQDYHGGRSGSDLLGGQEAPEPALDAMETPGHPLPQAPRARMENAFDRDFSAVRIHDGPQAAAGAASIGADAYTTGQDIVFGKDTFQPESPQGAALLSHELGHTLLAGNDPALRRGVGFFENIARFFGFGTFSAAELRDYLARLSGENKSGAPEGDTGKIEGDFDGDNKAREVVKQGMHKDQPIRVRYLLIEEMRDGVVTEADEEAIVQILRDASDADALEIINRVGSEELDKDLDGKDRDEFLEILDRVRTGAPYPVNLDVKLNYSISGAPNVLNGNQGVFVRALSATPIGGKPQTIATNESVTQKGQSFDTPLEHAPDKPGELSIDASPGPVSGDTVTPVAPGPQDTLTTYSSVGRQYDTAEVILDLFYSERQAGVDKVGHTKGEATITGTDKVDLKGLSDAHKTGTHDTEGEDIADEARIARAKKVEAGGAVRQGKKHSKKKGEGETEFKQKEDNFQDTEIDTETDVDTTDKVDLESNKTGTRRTKGSFNIDLDDIEFEADVKSELKGKAEIEKGSDSIGKKIYDLSEPVRRKVIRKVLKRYLGPLSGPAESVINEITDSLMSGKPDWVVTLKGNGKAEITGTVSGELKGKWDEVQTINEKTKTEGEINRKGKLKTKGKTKSTGGAEVEGKSKSRSKEEVDTDSIEIEGNVSQSDEIEAQRARTKTKVKRTTKIDEKTHTDSKLGGEIKVDRKEESESDFTGRDTNFFEAVFDRAELRVRLTGEKGRYRETSAPGQRGGGGKTPNQQREVRQ